MAHSSLDLSQRPRLSGISVAEVVRFVLAGILNTVVGYGAFFALSYFLGYLASLACSYVIGVTHSFFWNKYWTFRSNRKKAAELVKFVSVYVVAFLVNVAALAALVDGLKLDPKLGQLIVLPVTTMISYLGHKYWSFR